MPTLVTTRTREMTNFSRKPFHYDVFNPDGVYQGTPAGEVGQFTDYSIIKDNVNRKINGRYPASDAQHISIKTSLLSSLPNWTDLGGWTARNVQFPPILDDPSLVVGFLPGVSDALWDGFFLDAFDEFQTQIPQEVDTLNFVWEAREIESLIPKLQDTISKTISGGYLNWNFGWAPFLADLSTFANITSIVQKKIDHLIQINKKLTRISAFQRDVVSIPYIRDWIPVNGDNWQMRLRSYRADLRCNARLYSDLKGLHEESGFWRAAAVALGLTNPLRSFWESVPFSFVLDWFNKIGARTFNLRANPFQGVWDISGLTTSVVEHGIVDYRWSYPPNGSPVKLGTIAVERYTRYAGFPAQPSIFNLEALSPKQQTLLLALANGLR